MPKQDYRAEYSAYRDTASLTSGLGVSVEQVGEVASLLLSAEEAYRARCVNHAPFIFWVDARGVGHLSQGCCNSWECPRCTLIRAKQEYWRIVRGVEALDEAGEELYFVTLTCRGRDMPLQEAEENYLLWTNRLLTTMRTRAKGQGVTWAYAAVTERQQREHPHSHMITTFCPSDALETNKVVTKNGVQEVRKVLISSWFLSRVQSAGLGPQYEITRVGSPRAVAVYVAKYLFKEQQRTHWPKGWRRVRYSQSWPKQPEGSDEGDTARLAFAVLSQGDWERVALTAVPLQAEEAWIAEVAHAHGLNGVEVPTDEEWRRRANYERERQF